MRTEKVPKRHTRSSGMDCATNGLDDSENRSCIESVNGSGILTDVSRDNVNKLLRRVSLRRAKKQDNSLLDSGPKIDERPDADSRVTWNTLDGDGESCSRDAIGNTPREDKVDERSFQHTFSDNMEDKDDIDWEEGSLPISDSTSSLPDDRIKAVTIEFGEAPDTAKRKPIHRASAEDKEVAELVHKVHLLCLLARGRIIDSACDDPLIQASLLSLLPSQLLNISKDAKLTAKALFPLINWFHVNFHVRSQNSTERSFHSALASALDKREGTLDEVAALSVALFRALNITTRFVSILDVTSLKPDAEKSEFSQDESRVVGGIFNTTTLMVGKQSKVSTSLVKSFSQNEKNDVCETSLRASRKSNDSNTTSNGTRLKTSCDADQLNNKITCEMRNDISEACLNKKSQGSKRKGDLEFEMQLEMALSATAARGCESNIGSDVKDLHCNSSKISPQLKKMKRVISEESPTSAQGFSTAVGSKKVGSPLYWAEVYCSGENLTGKWVHVDAVNAIIDGEQKVEDAAAACKTSLRYVVAFAGCGAKDVTRRYCMKWYKIASQRINSIWWDEVLAPLRDLESGATGGVIHLEKHQVDVANEHGKVEPLRISDCPTQNDHPEHVNLHGKQGPEVSNECKNPNVENSVFITRNSLEDMELETRALTEPLPTNQQAYRNHQLYAIERWLTKYQILHPKDPILGFCSGHPVYPRTCVQTLKTKERWLREGMQVKAEELPAKVLKRSVKLSKEQVSEADDYDKGDSKGIIELYGKWQLEPLCLPHAVNGIVPKNERGQVDVWSEKCLPPGTVHLRLPRVFSVAKRLEIDYAPAMVGFDFKNGRSLPVYDGIVVCAEFKDVILEAYAEEEERREADEKKRREAQAISRWYQLLSSIVTRQRLNNCYGNGLPSETSREIQTTNTPTHIGGGRDDCESRGCQQEEKQDTRVNVPSISVTEDHEHVFLTEAESFDEGSSVRTKRCHCGFSVQVEEL